MRSYPTDSPQAAMRLVAMILLADGHAGGDEFAVLRRLDIGHQFGLSEQAWTQVLRDLCEDLQGSQLRQWSRACAPDTPVLLALLCEVQHDALRQRVLALLVAVAQADGRLSDGEGRLLALAYRQWQPEHWTAMA